MNKFKYETLKQAVSVLFLTFYLSSCSHGPKIVDTGDKTLPLNGNQRLLIMGTNDIHGNLLPVDSKSKEKSGQPPIPYAYGGTEYIASYIDILRSEYGNRLLYLDGGDEFQGTLESNTFEGAPIVQFLNEMKVDASSIGNHEFDYGPAGLDPSFDQLKTGKHDVLSALKERMKEAKYPYLAANIIETKTGKMPPFPNTLPSKIIDKDGIKVGVIGLTTVSTPFTSRREYVKDLSFTPLKDAVIRERQNLLKDGADIIVGVSHAGLSCDLSHDGEVHKVWTSKDDQGKCDSGHEIIDLLNEMPSGTFDAFVSGHTHTLVHHFVNGTPVIQAQSYGKYLNTIELNFSFDKGKPKLIREETEIEAAIPICAKFFKNQMDCNGSRQAPEAGRGELIPAVFHDAEIKPNPRITAMLKPYLEKVAKMKSEIVGETPTSLIHKHGRENPVTNLVADSLREATKSDFSLVNAGGVRTSIEAGKIMYGAAFRVLPFDNLVAVLKISGKDLKTALRIAFSGHSGGIFGISGLQLTMHPLEREIVPDDLNSDGKKEPWEIKRLISVKTADGKELSDSKMYSLATPDFLVSGGDYMGFAFGKLKAEQIQAGAWGYMRDVFVAYLKKHSPVQVPGNLAYDENNPRVRFQE